MPAPLAFLILLLFAASPASLAYCTPTPATRNTQHATRITYHVSGFTFHASRSPLPTPQTPLVSLHLTNTADYRGMADASGAVPVGTNLFIVANDEDNILRLYRSDQPGFPVQQFDFNAFLEVTPKSPEADLEAGARIGDRAFWIGSHGRNKVGKQRLNRDRFFATDIKVAGDKVTLLPVGRPYKELLDDLLADPQLARFHLSEASRLAPKAEHALNLEGLSATPDGHLLLGFRNPIPEGKALLVPMLNPNEVVFGKRAKLGPPLLLDLGGLGIRDIACYNGTYMIIAGPWDSGEGFRIYRWSGSADALPEPLRVNHLNRYHPEALVIYPDKGLREFQVLSDDGTLPVDGIPGKEVKDQSLKKFRSFWLRQ